LHNVWIIQINQDSVLNGMEFQAFGVVFGMIPALSIFIGEVALCVITFNSKKSRRQ
jgi:hypothetical protein